MRDPAAVAGFWQGLWNAVVLILVVLAEFGFIALICAPWAVTRKLMSLPRAIVAGLQRAAAALRPRHESGRPTGAGTHA